MAKVKSYTEEDWFTLLADDEKAKIIVTRIKEEAATQRKVHEEEVSARRNLHDNAGYMFSRILIIVSLAGLMAGALVVAITWIESWRHVKTCEANPSKCVPYTPPPASSGETK